MFSIFSSASGRIAPLLRPSLARFLHHLPTMSSGKISSPHFTSLLTPELLRLEGIFKSAGYQFRLVGGVVRDLLLGQAPKDIDVSTECRPEEMIRLLKRAGIRYIPTGLTHGTITVISGDFTCEVTTLRVDEVTDGRHAEVRFVNDWKEDALRRDLTINAMSLSLDGTLFDYFDGERHLAERKILFVGDPRSRIKEDYLRILRYFRFYGRIAPSDGSHDRETLEAVQELAGGLEGVSAERVWSEMGRILVGQQAPALLRVIYDVGVAKHIHLPPNGNLAELERVWGAMQQRPDDAHPLRPESLLACLVHSGKEFGVLADRWRLSRKQKNTGIFIATHRDVAYDPETPLKHFQDMLVTKTDPDLVFELLCYCHRLEFADSLRNWSVPVIPINGDDLIRSGVEPGRRLGVLLKDLQRTWMESGYRLSKQELLARVMAGGADAEACGGGTGEGEKGTGKDTSTGATKRRKVEQE